MPGSVRVRLFASAREAIGRPEVEWAVPAGGIVAEELVRALGRRFPALARVLPTCRFVRNGRYLNQLSQTVRPGDEFSVHPPYGGG
ncbi:MAG TPA: MoaD/ThiS family protein [Thermoplasmata archaeon]|nr:MoaD/ThiS family protein [Thermoplasmata archaeon]